jgi:hypothetical protein
MNTGPETTDRSSWWARVAHQLDAHRCDRDDLAALCDRLGSDHLASCQRGEVVRVVGRVTSITVGGRAGASPCFVATVTDGTETIDLVFLGRGRIAGIHPGALLEVRGRVSVFRNRPALYSPRYDLLPATP